jgi:outer membrane protein OmpA-like peptidoglycan-associated protein
MMKIALAALAFALAATPAIAQPNKSQHPRVGQLAELKFKTGSAELALNIEPQLAAVATWARTNPDGLVVLDGHADARGPSTRNVRLSLRRAHAVRRQLVASGVDPDQLVIAAYGEDGPRRRKVVIWGTRAGMDAVVARTLKRGHAVIWSGVITEMDRRPQPGAVARQ